MRTLEDFVLESNRIEDIHRSLDDPQFLLEVKAHEKFLQEDDITVKSLEDFVSVIQPDAELRRKVGQDVYVGNHVPPPGGYEIPHALGELLYQMFWVGAYKTHVEYEVLHPFTDGNGRSGRVLWLKQMGGKAPLGFLHEFYYQTLESEQR